MPARNVTALPWSVERIAEGSIDDLHHVVLLEERAFVVVPWRSPGTPFWICSKPAGTLIGGEALDAIKSQATSFVPSSGKKYPTRRLLHRDDAAQFCVNPLNESRRDGIDRERIRKHVLQCGPFASRAADQAATRSTARWCWHRSPNRFAVAHCRRRRGRRIGRRRRIDAASVRLADHTLSLTMTRGCRRTDPRRPPSRAIGEPARARMLSA